MRPSAIAPGLPLRSPSRPVAAGHLLERAEVEPGAERRALARQHDGAHAGLVLQPLARLGDGHEHGAVEGVALVGAVETDVGDAPFDGARDTIGHDRSLAAWSAGRGPGVASWPTMNLGLTADEVLTTTRSVRKRLDLARPGPAGGDPRVPADRAPGTDRLVQPGWGWVFVEDPAKKRAIADFYGANFDAYRERSRLAQFPDGDLRAERRDPSGRPRSTCAITSTRCPCCSSRSSRADSTAHPCSVPPAAWGSILPAVWSFMLALRERGLGSAWTTLHLPNEKEVAELLGDPVRRVHPGRTVPDRLHARHRLQARTAPAPR